MKTTVSGKISPTKNQARKLDELMRIQSSCMRYSYNRLCEGKTKSEIEADLREKFSEIKSRYRRGGYFCAKFNPNSTKSLRRLSKAGELDYEMWDSEKKSKNRR